MSCHHRTSAATQPHRVARLSLLSMVVVFFAANGAGAAGPAATPVERKDSQAVKRHQAILKHVQSGDVDLVFLGDSITQGWESTGAALFKTHYEPRKGANLGVGADMTQHALWRITKGGELKGLHPKVVVLMMGINNVASGHSPAQINEGIAALIKAIQDHDATTRVLLVSTFPAGKEATHKFRAPVKALNALLAGQANGDRVRFLDISAKFVDAAGRLTDAYISDGIHLNAKGYKVWADAMNPTLFALLGSGPTPPSDSKRSRWIHVDGDVIEISKGEWIERQKTGAFRFVEKARTAEFVELFDSTRDYTVRLTDTAMLIKGGNATAIVKFADFTKQRDGHFTAPPVKFERRRWVHADGDIIETSKGVWTERQKTGEFHFVEIGRTGAFVELLDASRGYTLRLTDEAMLIIGGITAPTFTTFTKERDGHWVDTPAPVKAGRRRLQWKYAGGFVQNEYNGAWSEKQTSGTVFHFVEKERSADHIELFDKSRGYTVRLTDSSMLIKGGSGALPKFADFTQLNSGSWADDFPSFELGKLSEFEESSGKGPDTVSSGRISKDKPDPGGISYGTYQLTTTSGNADTFVRRFFPTEFKGLKAGTASFSAKWREVARKDRVGFHKHEHDFIKETHHDRQVAKLQKDLGLNVAARSRVFQDVVWSTAVQHGPGATHIVNAVRRLLKGKTVDQLSEEEMIRAVYAERTARSQRELAPRFVRESAAALAALK
ncbi:MAG: GDSL-type esterase/lipase family protein [Gemmataceae bacterium]